MEINKKPSYIVHAINIILAYLIGLVIGNIILLPYTGALALVFIVGGVIIALPLLGITLLIIPFIKTSLEKNLKIWCIVATIIVPIAWLAMEYITNYSNKFDVAGYLSIRNVWERALLAFLCGGSSAVFYYSRMNKILQNE